MRCTNCNRELLPGTRFCPQCGREVEKEKLLEELRKEETEAEALARQTEQELKKWQKKKIEHLKRENKLQLKWDNLKKVEKGDYPEVKKYNFQEDKIELLKEKIRFPWCLQVVIAILGTASVFTKWFSINLIGNFLNLGNSSGTPAGNLVYLYNAVAKMNNLNSQYKQYADEHMVPSWVMIFLCLGICLMALFYMRFLHHFFTKKNELTLRKWMFGSAIYGIFISGTVLLLGEYIEGGFILGNNDLGMPYIFPDTGATFALTVSILGVIIFIIQTWGNKGFVEGSLDNDGVENKENDIEEAFLEIVNYNPILLFRPERILVTGDNTLKIGLEISNYEYPEIEAITAVLHLYKNDGSKIILPQVIFERTVNKKIMYGELAAHKLKFSELKEARIFIKEYRSKEDWQKGNDWYIDSNIETEVLQIIRNKSVYPIFMKSESYDGAVMCNCGQLYQKSLGICPLCGKKGEEKVAQQKTMTKELLKKVIPLSENSKQDVLLEKLENRRQYIMALVAFLGCGVVAMVIALTGSLVISITNPIKEQERFERACENIMGKWEARVDASEFPSSLEISQDNTGRYNGFPMTYVMNKYTLEITMNNTGNMYVYYYDFVIKDKYLSLQTWDGGMVSSYAISYEKVN